MIPGRHSRAAAALALLCGLSTVLLQAALARDTDPGALLARMATAVQSTSYEGTVIRESAGKEEVLRVVHSVTDGVVRERLIAQEGDGLEIIRNGNEVHVILPERKSVLVEEWNDQGTLFSTLPSSDIKLGNEYDAAILRSERVAGREAYVLAIRPHDEFRFGHWLWLDRETGFPLQSRLIDTDGSTLEQVKFADIRFGGGIAAGELKPTYSIQSFKWYAEPARQVTPAVAASWECEQLPGGFRLVSTQEEVMPGNEQPVIHMLFSDGVASVSVFVDRNAGKAMQERSSLGSSNSYSTVIEEHRVTAVGGVPEQTVEQIASSMRLK
jgi:sigma-E factor negative regulatory protein RseB